MKFYLDSADLIQIEQFNTIVSLAGVTTNPSIIAKSGFNLFETLEKLRSILQPQQTLFAQTLAENHTNIVKEAELLNKKFENIVIKIPVTSEGLKAIKILQQDGISTLGTAIYTPMQALLATLAGADYVAPYISRVDAQGGNSRLFIEELQTLIELHSPNTQVIAASFKTPRQVLDCLLAGCSAVTVSPEIIQLMLDNPSVSAAVRQFTTDWQNAFGNLKLS